VTPLQLNFDIFPILTTEKYILRKAVEGDVDEVFAFRSDPDVMKYIPRPLAQSKEDALGVIKMMEDVLTKKEGINWAITSKENDKMMGVIGLYRIAAQNFRCELGYMILPKYHNQGIISSLIPIVLDFAFNSLQFNSIEAVIDPRNKASEVVLQKNRFQKEAHIKENLYWNGEFVDTVIYSILRRDFNAGL